MIKKTPIAICFLALIIVFCGIFLGNKNNIEKQEKNYYDEFINAEIFKYAKETIDEGEGIKTFICQGQFRDKSGIFITALSDNSIFNDESISVTMPEISLILSDGKSVECSAEVLDNRIIFISDTDININISDTYKINYKYELHLSFDNKEKGKIVFNKTDLENFIPCIVTLFNDTYFTLENVAVTKNNNEKNKSDVTVTVTPCKHLSAGVSSIGQAVYIDYGYGEKKLSYTGNSNYTCLIPSDFEQIIFRFTAENIYATCSGTSKIV